jgi:hypothetical protein
MPIDAIFSDLDLDGIDANLKTDSYIVSQIAKKLSEKANALFKYLSKEYSVIFPESIKDNKRIKLYFESAGDFREKILSLIEKLDYEGCSEEEKAESEILKRMANMRVLAKNYLVSQTDKNALVLLKNDANLSSKKVYEVELGKQYNDTIIKTEAKLVMDIIERENEPANSKTIDFNLKEKFHFFNFKERGKYGDLVFRIDDTTKVIIENSSKHKEDIYYVEIARNFRNGSSVVYFAKAIEYLNGNTIGNIVNHKSKERNASLH